MPKYKFSSLALTYLWDFLWVKATKKQRTFIGISFASLIISKLFSASAPLIFKQTVGHLVPDSSGILIWLIGAYVFANVLDHAFANLRDVVFARVESTVHKQITLAVFEHLHRLSLDFHLKKRTGSLARVIERGTQSLERFFRFTLFMLGPTLFEILLVIGLLLAFYSPYYGLTTLCILILYISYTYIVTAKRLQIVREMNAHDTQANGEAIDSILNYETVKYFGNEAHEYRNYDKLQTAYQRTFVQSRDSLAILNEGQNIIMYGGMLFLLIPAAWEVQAGTIKASDFILFHMYLMQLYLPLSNIGFAYRELRLALTNMEEMFKLFQEKPSVVDSPTTKRLLATAGHIRFRRVSFSYNPRRQILTDFSLTIRSRQTVAIVGFSGGGKSTLVRLLYRFYEPTSGGIEIDGTDVRSYTQDSVRKQIAIVPQDTVLFNKSLYYNIGYGNPSATRAQIEAATKEAELHAFIQKLPDGYNTIVGERGLKLSGGEKQRVAIARTILKNAPILVLDEATSALDSQTEKEIQDNLIKISKDRTTIMIAHRLSTIVHADNIIVLDNGKIVESGTHRQLLLKKGEYAKLWLKQSENK